MQNRVYIIIYHERCIRRLHYGAEGKSKRWEMVRNLDDWPIIRMEERIRTTQSVKNETVNKSYFHVN